MLSHAMSCDVMGIVRILLRRCFLEFPDFRFDVPIAHDDPNKETLLAEQAIKFEDGMKNFFERSIDASVAEWRRESAESGKDAQRVSNSYYGLAVEKSMYMGCGISFIDFQSSHMPGPLAYYECRQYVKVGSFPDGSPIFRAIIRNLRTKAKRWELPDVLVNGVPTEKSLHTFIDRASIGAPFTNWLYQSKKSKGLAITTLGTSLIPAWRVSSRLATTASQNERPTSHTMCCTTPTTHRPRWDSSKVASRTSTKSRRRTLKFTRRFTLGSAVTEAFQKPSNATPVTRGCFGIRARFRVALPALANFPSSVAGTNSTTNTQFGARTDQ